MTLRNDEYVERRLRLNVVERNKVIVLMYPLGG
jgi:hypothetical protein